MASCTVETKKISSGLVELSVYWAASTTSLARKFCPNLPIYVNSHSQISGFITYICRCARGRVSSVTHSMYLDVSGELVHLFNADAKTMELFILNWHGSAVEKNLKIKPFTEQKPEVVTDLMKVKVLDIFKAAAATRVTPARKAKLESSVNAASDRFAEEDKSKIKFGSSYDFIKGYMVPTIESSMLLPTNVAPQKLDFSRKIMASSDCRIEKSATVGFVLHIPANHPAVKRGAVLCTTLPFKTRKGAIAAMAAIDNDSVDNSMFCLYISQRETLDIYVNGSQVTNRKMYKMIAYHENLINVFMDDWGGTSVGYSLHKSIQKDLGVEIGKSEDGQEYLADIVSVSDAFLNTQSTSLTSYF